jgi:hypothetical protein
MQLFWKQELTVRPESDIFEVSRSKILIFGQKAADLSCGVRRFLHGHFS